MISALQLLTFSLPALAADLHVAAGESIQDVMNEAIAGDTVIIAAGTYDEDLSTENGGEPEAPITVRGDGEVIITASGEVLQIDHGHWRFEQLILDGQYGSADTLDINDDAHSLVLSNVEVRRSGTDCIDMGAPADVRIESSLIHHCLQYDDDEEVRVDAHGITGGAVQNLTITDTDIHTFSGDGIQFDPSRSAPGWNNITIENCRIWLEPLDEATAGFPAGSTPGENAIDTKTATGGDRATLTVKDSEFWGFRDTEGFSNQAALLFKENVDVTVSRSHIYDSEIALRVRGPTPARPEGAHVTIDNSLIHDVEVGVRYEDEVESLSLLHITTGVGVATLFEAVDSDSRAPTIRSSLFLADDLPESAATGHNGAATHDDFIDAAGGDYHLSATSSAIDAGEEIAGIETDFDGGLRLEGEAPDQGAFEFGHAPEDTGQVDTGQVDTGLDDTDVPDGPDLPTESGPSGPSGVGAAESTDEKGGFGCSQTPRQTPPPWPLMGLFMALCVQRRR